MRLNRNLGPSQDKLPLECLLPFLLSFVVLAVAGCAASTSSGSSGTTTTTPTAPANDPYANMSGNWQISATPTVGSSPFTVLSGYVYEINVNAAAHQTTASLLVQSTGCFSNAGALQLIGNVEEPKVSLASFEINDQVVTLNAQKDEAGETLSGTYSIAGGCADGNTGTITGSRYTVLTGTYAGTAQSDATKGLSLSLTQAGGTGSGIFLMSGSAALTGFSCFSKGTLVGGGTSYVSGSSTTLVFTSNEASGSQITMVGSIDQAADTLSLSSIQVTGGACAGSYGSATLAKD